MRADTLRIAIDETGTFAQAKLRAAQGQPSSGIVAVLSTWEESRLTAHLHQLALSRGITRLDQFHRMDLARTLESSAVESIKRAMEPAIDALVGVRGTPAGRIYFHEQEAYGEALFALIDLVWERHRDKVKAIERVELIVATRKQVELVGYSDRHDYHRQLEGLLRHYCQQAGWPDRVRILTRDARHHPHLVLADWHAFDVLTSNWASDLRLTDSRNNRRAIITALARSTTIGSVLGQLSAGKTPSVHALDHLSGQMLHDALIQLLSLARAHIRDRDGGGHLTTAATLLDVVWRASERLSGSSLRSQACLLAAEISSHRGLSEAAFEGTQWRARTVTLEASEWGANVWERQARTLEDRCQMAQVLYFNVFDFETAFVEFDDERARYEEAAGGHEAVEHDELYGKILGTIGQACGFLRAQMPELGCEAWGYLDRSARCFERSEPVYRMMSLGYQLTDLWDRGLLDQCKALMTSKHVASPEGADGYALLHRLRLAAAQAYAGSLQSLTDDFSGGFWTSSPTRNRTEGRRTTCV